MNGQEVEDAMPALCNAIENDQPAVEEKVEPSQEERIEEAKTDAQANISQRLQALGSLVASGKLRPDQFEVEAEKVRQEETDYLASKITEIEDEFDKRTRRCYQHYQRDYAADEQKETPQYQHKYARVGPGELGPYTTSITDQNRYGIRVLIKGLLDDLYDNFVASRTPGAFHCAQCDRTLELPMSQRMGSMITACRACLGILYCSPLCRTWHKYTHQFTCSLHPGWLLPEAATLELAQVPAEQGDGELEPVNPERYDLLGNRDLGNPPAPDVVDIGAQPPPLPPQDGKEPGEMEDSE